MQNSQAGTIEHTHTISQHQAGTDHLSPELQQAGITPFLSIYRSNHCFKFRFSQSCLVPSFVHLTTNVTASRYAPDTLMLETTLLSPAVDQHRTYILMAASSTADIPSSYTTPAVFTHDLATAGHADRVFMNLFADVRVIVLLRGNPSFTSLYGLERVPIFTFEVEMPSRNFVSMMPRRRSVNTFGIMSNSTFAPVNLCSFSIQA